jgi:hypothetical protein
MELKIINKAFTLQECLQLASDYFNTPLRTIQEEMSMFEQYIIRPINKTFIPKIWSYRIVCRNSVYYFGQLK